MHFTPKEMDKLMLHMAGIVARERLERGLKLNYPEAIALISSELIEKAREGADVTQLMQYGKKILTAEQVMDGVPEMIPEIQIEATFLDGTKLVTVHTPIEPNGKIIPGEILVDDGEIEINGGRQVIEMEVVNKGDRPVQVGSHYHFFEVNKQLSFDRKAALGKRLDIPSGTAVRFEPGEKKLVHLIPLGGLKQSYGLNNLVEGSLVDPQIRDMAIKRAKDKGFE